MFTDRNGTQISRLSLRAQLQLQSAASSAIRTCDRMSLRASREAQRAARADFRRAVEILAEAAGAR